ncbi:bis(5'-nucleosyl)-tetraphosphatase (symmetrical) YqeK [Clostridium sp. D2Q-14]|uniref:bis(5'-nucleosyl)-tetraphosphatase (symmetrical) YqeK n=1 Tax=Anaeromonas gelatinilytica TaxID=2683194 RepID=UPI00193BFB73|nr:bis(5'-nucleosyl)-tetraphosphatase (symmetrical) YqeK [Anaeromonas gelatinilytica]MBS4535852.1 bis(5'-nucleosyl)-tetraphosphatase (symmetrical) YqeK [Anaeromonas gelatinilytica]
MDIENIKKELKLEIDKERYNHTLRVVDIAKRLALVYRIDEKKVELAALLHDCGKYKDIDVLLKKVEEFGIILDIISKNNHHLIHSHLGAEIAKKKYDIVDEDILNAIKYHTTGRRDMSILEKVIFIADYIEPERDFDGIEDIRKLAFEDIDEAIIVSMENTIKYIIDKGLLIHPNTISTRNSLILLRNKNRRSWSDRQ